MVEIENSTTACVFEHPLASSACMHVGPDSYIATDCGLYAAAVPDALFVHVIDFIYMYTCIFGVHALSFDTPVATILVISTSAVPS